MPVSCWRNCVDALVSATVRPTSWTTSIACCGSSEASRTSPGHPAPVLDVAGRCRRRGGAHGAGHANGLYQKRRPLSDNAVSVSYRFASLITPWSLQNR